MIPTLLVSFALVASPPGSSSELRLLHWNAQELALTQKRIEQEHAPTLRAWKRLRQEADRALELTPPTVMDKSFTPSSGTKHDYHSFGPYWWPDPKQDDGLPYIRRDGEKNPASEGKASDRPALKTMVDATEALSLAYHLSGEEKYAAKAAELLRAWFLESDTRMNPHLKFGQAIPGRTQGRGIGLIETRTLLAVVESVGLLSQSEAWSAADDRRLKQWFAEFLDWMLTSRHGQDEDTHGNNHSTWYDAQVVSFAWFTEQHEVARKRLRQVGRRRIETQINPQGHQPHELARTRSFDYSTMNLQGLLTLAAQGKHYQVELWEYEGEQGQSIPQALWFLASFADSDRQWPHKQIKQIDRSEHLLPLLAQAVVLFDSDKARQAIRKLDTSTESGWDPRLLWPSGYTD